MEIIFTTHYCILNVELWQWRNKQTGTHELRIQTIVYHYFQISPEDTTTQNKDNMYDWIYVCSSIKTFFL